MFGYFDEAQKVIAADSNGAEVWISGSKFAENQQLVLKEGFVLVISCMETPFRFKNTKIQHLRFPIEDDQTCDIKAYFIPAFQVIQAGRKTGKVLIYSTLGISRASTILIAYIIQKYNKKSKEALQQLKLARPCCQPSQSYLKQLQWFQRFQLNRF